MHRLFACAVARVLIPLAAAQNLGAQSPSASNPPSPQTARQALIEMFFGTAANHLEKHLPDVTRKTLHRLGTANGQDALAEFSMFSMQAKAMGAGFQTFDSGPTLLIAEDPRTGDGQRVELTVERDDLIGEEDQIELGLHITRNGKEDTTLPFIPRFTFIMKRESDVWRLNEISVTVRLPLADPDFLKGLEDRQRSQNEQMTIWAMSEVTTAQKGYQSTHGGFACALSALGNTGKQPQNGGPLYDPQLASGKKNGYVFAISGCDGTHYKIVAEPAVPDSGQRAFCSDEIGAVRAAADGRATTCLASGEPVLQGNTLIAPRVD